MCGTQSTDHRFSENRPTRRGRPTPQGSQPERLHQKRMERLFGRPPRNPYHERGARGDVRVVLGGTFDPLHAGHISLLEHAVRLAEKDGSIHIGLVTDRYSTSKRQRKVAPFEQRDARLRTWLEVHGMENRYKINPLDDPYGPSATGDYDAIVASVETAGTANRVNEHRQQNGLALLRVEIVPYVLAQDLLPITATRIAEGLIDEQGERQVPLHVNIGSTNPVKVRAAKNAFARFMPRIRIETHPKRIQSGVPEQPQGAQAAAGAQRRAQMALEAGRKEGAEYGVGIEAGIVQDPHTGVVMDVQHCMIVDTTGYTTHGHGSGFAYPPMITKQILEEGITVSQAFEPLTKDPRLGRHEGAVGWLTHGVLDRTRLTEQAVEAAMIPRVRRGLWEPHTVPP